MQLGSDILRAWKLFRSSWRLFLVIHLTASLAALAVLTPLYSTLVGWLILASGDVALTDEDILFFILSPAGLLSFWVAASIGVVFVVFEQAALFMAAWQATAHRPTRLIPLARLLLARSWPIFLLALRMMLRVALLALPFLVALAVIYQAWLTQYDINYYLAARPPEFWLAGGAAAICLGLMALVLLRELAGWVAALPLLLLGQAGPGEAHQLSRDRAAVERWRLVGLLLLWVLFHSLLLAIMGGLLDLGAGVLTTLGGFSLQALAWGMGVLLLAWSLGNLASSFLGNCALGLGLFVWFRRLFPELGGQVQSFDRSEPPARFAQARRGASGLALVVAALFIAAGWVVHSAMERQSVGGETLIVAHRGASGEAPENTLAAMELAVEQGADWVEIDVQETRDGAVVVAHDRDLMKIGGVPLGIREASLADLQEVDIGARFGPEFAGQAVPTLRQALLQLRGRAGVLIELKYYGGEQALEERVAAVVEEMGMAGSVMVMSLNLPAVRKMKALRPGWRVGLLSSVAAGDMTRLDADFLAVNARLARRPFIERARLRGKAVYAWTVNDPVSMSAMMGRDLAGIITDYPGLAHRVRAERAELALHERFILQVASALGSDLDLPQ